MVNTTYNSTEDMIENLQSSKGKTNKKIYKIIGNFYYETNIGNFKLKNILLVKKRKELLKSIMKYCC